MMMFLFVYSLLFAFCTSLDARGDSCLSRSATNSSICVCCTSGYRGDDCKEVCPNCESRLMVDGLCVTKCRDGYYGTSCNMHCSVNCIGGNSGISICRTRDGFCVNGCTAGRFGVQCALLCSENCHNKKCVQNDGKCTRCKDNLYYRNDCSVPCSSGCYNGTCTISGACTGGCKDSYYGEKCTMPCETNCKNMRCTFNASTGFTCADGCNTGYTSSTCTDKCPDYCAECHQNDSQCISCVESAEKHCENGDCLNGIVSCRPQTPQGFKYELLLGILIPSFILILLLFLFLKKKGCFRTTYGICVKDIEADCMTELLSDTEEGENQTKRRKTECQTIPGTLGDEITQQRIKEAERIFVQTSSFEDVKTKMEEYCHVTIIGASGEGKTTMSLMLAREYMENGYQVVFVEKIDEFNLNECVTSGHKTFVIFDDIFGSVGFSTHVTQLRNIFTSLFTILRQCKEDKTANVTGRLESTHTIINNHPSTDILIVFTSKTYNFQNGKTALQYERFPFFNEDSVVDLTDNKGHSYSDVEKIAIFEKNREMYGKSTMQSLPLEDLINVSNTLFGFPMTCRLYFELPSFTEKADNFFTQPLFYLRLELQTLLSQENEQTAALALMLLCENKLNLCDLELSGQNQLMDERCKLLLNIFPSVTRLGIFKATRNFRGTVFTGGDLLQFAHSSICDACAYVLYQFKPGFVLKNCSDDFLYERLKAEISDKAEATENSHYILVSQPYFDLVASRLYSSIHLGKFSKTITHPILRSVKIARLLLDKIHTKSNESSAEDSNWIHCKDKDKGLLYWVVQGHSTLLIDEIENVLNVTFTQSEIREALDATVEKNNLTHLELLLSRIDKERQYNTTGELLLLCAEHGSVQSTRYLLQEADVNITDDNKNNLLHLACNFGDANVLRVFKSKKESCLNHTSDSLFNSINIVSRTPAMLAAYSGSEECFQLAIGETNIDIKDNYGNSVIHYACRGGNKNIVQQIISNANNDSRGQHKQTPVMLAAVHGHMSVFEFLVSNNADLTLVDDSGSSSLHLACQGANTSIVKQLVSSSNIDSIGRNNWTPVMFAVDSGHNSVFEFLVSINADLTLVDDGGSSLLHLACQGGNTSIVKQLVSSSNIDSRGRNNWTPVMFAVDGGHMSVFELLVSNNADLTLVDDSGSSLLHLACQGGNTSIVKQLVSSSNIDSKGRNNWTPVMFAVVKGHSRVFELLVSNNADLTLISDSGSSLLHLACQGGNTSIVKQLVFSSNIDKRGKHNWTPVMFAVCSGHMNLFEVLVSNNADLTLISDSGSSLLHLACQGGNTSIVKDLVSSSNIDSRGKNNWTPVMFAVGSGHMSLFEFLVSNNADLTLVDDGGSSLLHLACQGGNTSIVKQIVSSSNIDSRGKNKRIPAMYAVVKGHMSVFEFLVSNNADLNLKDDSGSNVLHLASQGGNTSIVKQLVSSSNVDSRGKNKRTPVMFAVLYGHMSVFEFLILNNAETTLVDDGDSSLLHLACQGGNTSIVKQLVSSSNIDSRGKHKQTPAMYAVVKGHMSVFEFLVSNNADVTLVDDSGSNLLHLACQGGNTSIVKQLVSSSNIDSRGKNNRTPVMFAIDSGHMSVFELLVSNNADLTLVDDSGSSLLHLACQGGNTSIVKQLVSSSNIDSRGRHGCTPVMVAACCGHIGVIELLIENKADLTLVNEDGIDCVSIAKKRGKGQVVKFLQKIL